MRRVGDRLVFHAEIRVRRLVATVAILLIAGALVGGWIALRNNGLVGGLDHDGPLDALLGNEAGLVCTTTDVEVANDQLKNQGDSPLIIDRMTLNGPTRGMGLVVSEPQTFPVVPAAAITRVNKHAPPPRRPAAGTVIPAHGDSGVSYMVRYSGKFGGRPLQENSEVTFSILGETVDYHVGSRHFRETNGIVVTMKCHGKKDPPRKPRKNLPGHV